MNRDLLARATPRPWFRVDDDNEDDAALILAAVNEYEALLDLEAWVRDVHLPASESTPLLARLDAIRSESSRPPVGLLPSTSPGPGAAE